MPDKVEIVRKQIMVVDKVGTNTYNDLTWTDMGGKSYKVKSTRKQYFEAIVPGQAVEISFAKYHNVEYPYSAEKVADKIPDKVVPDEQFKAVEKEQIDKAKPDNMTKSDWSEKDRITRKSIERQKALELAVEWAKMTGDTGITDVLDTARQFEAYLEGKVQPSKLVEVANKLGAVESNPGGGVVER